MQVPNPHVGSKFYLEIGTLCCLDSLLEYNEFQKLAGYFKDGKKLTLPLKKLKKKKRKLVVLHHSFQISIPSYISSSA